MTELPSAVPLADDAMQASAGGLSVREILGALRARILLLVVAPLCVGVAALGFTYLTPPIFTASTTFLPPQQSQSAAASAIASLGSLASLAGGVAGVRSSADQYLALMQSVTVSDRIIERFGLMDAYNAKFRADARRKLGNNVRINLGKKDGLINVQVDDTSPQRAADIANSYVEELRKMTSTLAISEAQQRRLFFQQHLEQSRARLVSAQQSLQASGFNPGALKAEPKAAAEGYARLKAEIVNVEVRLQAMRGTLTEASAEVQQQRNTLAALRGQLSRVEQATQPNTGPDYITRYRDFKYEEALFEVYARQFELARADESREGALIQVIDPATPPERKSRPARALTAIGATLVSLLLVVGWVLIRSSMKRQTHGAP